jgi:hypothetical protein
MASHPMHRPRRIGWRFVIGLSVLGLLIVASASHANAATGVSATVSVTLAR